MHDQAVYRERIRIERRFKVKHFLNLALRIDGRAPDQRHKLAPLHSTPIAAEEMPRDYQFSAHTASVCCIAKGSH